jgi:Lar family restriction alleviation protein
MSDWFQDEEMRRHSSDLTNPKEADEMKACPFCGSANIDPEGWASTETRGPACDDCGASAGSAHRSLAENIAAWNTRTSSTATIKRVKQLEDLVHESLFHLRVDARAEAYHNRAAEALGIARQKDQA